MDAHCASLPGDALAEVRGLIAVGDKHPDVFVGVFFFYFVDRLKAIMRFPGCRWGN
jgi:hypothetical protein